MARLHAIPDLKSVRPAHLAQGREKDARAPFVGDRTVRMVFIVYTTLVLWAVIGGLGYAIFAL